MGWVQLGIWGDSLVHGGCDQEMGGWVNRLRLYLGNRGLGDHCFNLGLGGATSADLLQRIKAEIGFRTNHIDYVLVSVGINDMLSQAKGLTIANFRQNLAEIVAIIRASGKTPYLISLTPCRNIDMARWQEYFDAAHAVAREQATGWIDVSHAFAEEKLVDNVHPNAGGHAGIYQAVKAVLLRDGIIPPEA